MLTAQLIARDAYHAGQSRNRSRDVRVPLEELMSTLREIHRQRGWPESHVQLHELAYRNGLRDGFPPPLFPVR